MKVKVKVKPRSDRDDGDTWGNLRISVAARTVQVAWDLLGMAQMAVHTHALKNALSIRLVLLNWRLDFHVIARCI